VLRFFVRQAGEAGMARPPPRSGDRSRAPACIRRWDRLGIATITRCASIWTRRWSANYRSRADSEIIVKRIWQPSSLPRAGV